MIKLVLILSFYFTATALNAAVLVEDGKRKVTENSTSSGGINLRKERRVGIGGSGAGPLGLIGANLELNFSPEWGLMTGFGTGFSYQAYTLQVKRVLAGEYLLPYMAAGISRWYTVGDKKGPISDIQPSFFGGKFLSDSEKASGVFSKFLLYPAFGLQYVQLDGDWAGFSVFAELLLLVDIEDFQTAPTGTVGFLYYF